MSHVSDASSAYRAMCFSAAEAGAYVLVAAVARVPVIARVLSSLVGVRLSTALQVYMLSIYNRV